MKVWHIQSRSGRGGKFYFSETAYLKATYKNDARKVFVFEMVDGGIESGKYSESLFLKRERDDQLSTVLGEATDFTVNINNFRTLFEKICPDKKSFYTTKSELSKAFKIINDKKTFSTFVSNHHIKMYLLFTVSDSVEWYESLLKCHGFQFLPEDKRAPISEERMKNFLEAKSKIKKKKR
jgi:hypothetical protein